MHLLYQPSPRTPGSSAVPPFLLRALLTCLAFVSPQACLDDYAAKAAARGLSGAGPRPHGAPRGAPVTVSVSVVGQAAQKIVFQATSMSTVGQIRARVSQEAGIPVALIRLISTGKELKEDGRTLAGALGNVSDRVTLHVARRPAPDGGSPAPGADAASSAAAAAAAQPPASAEGAEAGPGALLASPEHFDCLFGMLRLDPRVAQKVWDLLMQLPTNERMLSEIRALETAEHGALDWDALLDDKSTFRLYYSLQIVEMLAAGPPAQPQEAGAPEAAASAAASEPWAARFQRLGGADRLFAVLYRVDFSDPARGAKRKPCLALLLRLLASFYLAEAPARPAAEAEEAPWPSLGPAPLPPAFAPDYFARSLLCVLAAASREPPPPAPASAARPRSASASSDPSSPLSEGGAAAATTPVPAAGAPAEGDDEEAEVVRHALRLFVAFAAGRPGVLSHALASPDFGPWLRAVLLEAPDPRTRAESARALAALAAGVSPGVQATLPEPPLAALLRHSLALLSEAAEARQRSCEAYFGLLARLVGEACAPSSSPSSPEPVDALAYELVGRLKAHPIRESRTNPDDEDRVLTGYLQLLAAIARHRPAFKAAAGPASGGGLLDELFHRCLFGGPTQESHGPFCPPRCKSRPARRAAFELLAELARGDTANFEYLTTLVLQQQAGGASRTLWHYSPALQEKGPLCGGYTGLRNLGATCYMNSLMQQFFMIPSHSFFSSPFSPRISPLELVEERGVLLRFVLKPPPDFFSPPRFRRALLAVPSEDEAEKGASLLYQLQALFAGLQESVKKYVDTQRFCGAYRDVDGQPVNTALQGNILQLFFGGTVVNQIICRDCPHRSERDEPFYVLSLDVKSKRSVNEALQLYIQARSVFYIKSHRGLYIQGEMLEGDNAYQCATCAQKRDALKRCCVSSLPNCLILHLKRFEWDLDTMKKFKVNDHVEFPALLDMEPFTREGLARREAAPAQAGGGDDVPMADARPERGPGYYRYALAGILVHTGTADSGHYYSYIQEREPGTPGEPRRWFHFNDTQVETFDEADIGRCCFGGAESVLQWDAAAGRQVARWVPKPHSAYMLFYERLEPEPVTIPALPEAVLSPGPGDRPVVPPAIYSEVWEENGRFLADRNVFDSDYFEFCWRLANMFPPLPPPSPMQISDGPGAAAAAAAGASPALRTAQLAIHFFVETLAHAKDKTSMAGWVAHTQALLTALPEACRWFLDALSDLRSNCWLRQLLLACTVPDVRSAAAGLILHAVAVLRPFEAPRYLECDEAGPPADEEEAPSPPPSTAAEQQQQQQQQQQAPVGGKQKAPQWPAAGADEDDESMDGGEGGAPPGRSPLAPRLTGRPATSIARLMDALFALIREAAAHWRHFAQFFGLIRDVALLGPEELSSLISWALLGPEELSSLISWALLGPEELSSLISWALLGPEELSSLISWALLGPEERAFMLQRNVAARLVDFYLGDESPHAPSGAKHRQKKTKMGDKFGQPSLAGMAATLSLLARSCTPASLVSGGGGAGPGPQPPAPARPAPPAEAAATSPLAAEGAPLSIGTYDRDMILNERFLHKVLREQVSAEAVGEILAHATYRAPRAAASLLYMFRRHIEALAHSPAADGPAAEPFLEAIAHLCALNDDAAAPGAQEALNRAGLAVQTLLGLAMTPNVARHPRLLASILSHAGRLAITHPAARDLVRGRINVWLPDLMVGAPGDAAREAAALLLRACWPDAFPPFLLPTPAPSLAALGAMPRLQHSHVPPPAAVAAASASGVAEASAVLHSAEQLAVCPGIDEPLTTVAHYLLFNVLPVVAPAFCNPALAAGPQLPVVSGSQASIALAPAFAHAAERMEQDARGALAYRLVQLLRSARLFIRSERTRAKIARECWEPLWGAFVAIDDKMVNADENKLELLRLLYALYVEDYGCPFLALPKHVAVANARFAGRTHEAMLAPRPSARRAASSSRTPSPSASYATTSTCAVRQDESIRQFNRATLPWFYRLMRLVASNAVEGFDAARDFLYSSAHAQAQGLASPVHHNLSWAITALGLQWAADVPPDALDELLALCRVVSARAGPPFRSALYGIVNGAVRGNAAAAGPNLVQAVRYLEVALETPDDRIAFYCALTPADEHKRTYPVSSVLPRILQAAHAEAVRGGPALAAAGEALAGGFALLARLYEDAAAAYHHAVAAAQAAAAAQAEGAAPAPAPARTREQQLREHAALYWGREERERERAAVARAALDVALAPGVRVPSAARVAALRAVRAALPVCRSTATAALEQLHAHFLDSLGPARGPSPPSPPRPTPPPPPRPALAPAPARAHSPPPATGDATPIGSPATPRTRGHAGGTAPGAAPPPPATGTAPPRMPPCTGPSWRGYGYSAAASPYGYGGSMAASPYAAAAAYGLYPYSPSAAFSPRFSPGPGAPPAAAPAGPASPGPEPPLAGLDVDLYECFVDCCCAAAEAAARALPPASAPAAVALAGMAALELAGPATAALLQWTAAGRPAPAPFPVRALERAAGVLIAFADAGEPSVADDPWVSRAACAVLERRLPLLALPRTAALVRAHFGAGRSREAAGPLSEGLAERLAALLASLASLGDLMRGDSAPPPAASEAEGAAGPEPMETAADGAPADARRCAAEAALVARALGFLLAGSPPPAPAAGRPPSRPSSRPSPPPPPPRPSPPRWPPRRPQRTSPPPSPTSLPSSSPRPRPRRRPPPLRPDRPSSFPVQFVPTPARPPPAR
eukprot:tig00021281_g19915.t1